MPKSRLQYHNSTMSPVPVHLREITKEEAKQEFARRLQERMTQANMNQSDLARKAKMFAPPGVQLGRANVSKYVTGSSIAKPVILRALAQALNCKPEDLLPSRGVPSAAKKFAADTAPVSMRDLGDGNVELKVNQVVPWPIALEMIQRLKGSIDPNLTVLPEGAKQPGETTHERRPRTAANRPSRKDRRGNYSNP